MGTILQHSDSHPDKLNHTWVQVCDTFSWYLLVSSLSGFLAAHKGCCQTWSNYFLTICLDLFWRRIHLLNLEISSLPPPVRLCLRWPPSSADAAAPPDIPPHKCSSEIIASSRRKHTELQLIEQVFWSWTTYIQLLHISQVTTLVTDDHKLFLKMRLDI